MKHIYILISKKHRTHYGAYSDEREAREQAYRFEELDNLERGEIDIYDITERWMFGFTIRNT